MHRPRLLGVLIVVCLGIPLTVSPGHVSAQESGGSGSAGYDDGYVFAGYEEHPVEVTTVTRDRSRTPTRVCVHLPIGLGLSIDEIMTYSLDRVRELARTYRGELIDGNFYILVCFRTAATNSPYYAAVIEYHHRDPTNGEVTTITDVEEFARELIMLPEPTIATAPPPERLVVGFETWFATPSPIDAAPRSAQAGPLWARAEPVPIAITYDFGNGATVTCDAPLEPAFPGTRDDERPDCTRFTYLDSLSDSGAGEFAVVATVTYDIWLTTRDDPAPHLADRRDGPPALLPVRVREIQAVIR